jgi:hypothetical protein
MTTFHHQLLTKEGRVFGQWINSSIIHDSICSLIHKMRCPKIYNSDIKYHMIFSVVVGSPHSLLAVVRKQIGEKKKKKKHTSATVVPN